MHFGPGTAPALRANVTGLASSARHKCVAFIYYFMFFPHSGAAKDCLRQIWSDVAFERLLQESITEHKAGTSLNLATLKLFQE